MPIPQSVQKIPGRISKATNELVFRVARVPALGLVSYVITKKTQDDTQQNEPETQPLEPETFIGGEVNKYNLGY